MTEPGDPSSTLGAEGITKSFDGSPLVLEGVDLNVGAGRTLALLGPSGCGKTTLLRILAGLDRADAGAVTLGGRVLSGPGVWVEPEKRRIGMVFQDWALFPHLSVTRNVGFGLPRAERKSSRRINEALDLVGLTGLGDRAPSTLSGGQQQRVALARAIAPRPAVLLLDEPFSNLDASLRARVRTELHQLLVQMDTTTVFVTHDQSEAFVLGDEVAVMSGGTIVQSAPPAEIYRRPHSRWVAEFVGEANILAGVASGGSVLTSLGELPLDSPRSGAVQVLIRPESLAIRAGSTDDGSGGRVGSVLLVEYFGHGTTYLVGAGDGELRVRTQSEPRFVRGDTVLVDYSGGSAVAFPAGS